MHQFYKGERRVGRSQRPNSPTDSHAVATTAGLRPRHRLPFLTSYTNQPSCQTPPIEPAATWTSARSHTPGTAVSPTITPSSKPLRLNQAPPTPQRARFSVTWCSVEGVFHFESRSAHCQRCQIAAPHSSTCMGKIVRRPPSLMLRYI